MQREMARKLVLGDTFGDQIDNKAHALTAFHDHGLIGAAIETGIIETGIDDGDVGERDALPWHGKRLRRAQNVEERDYHRHERGDNRACNFEGQSEPMLHSAPALTSSACLSASDRPQLKLFFRRT
jgi:hypothetical protein